MQYVSNRTRPFTDYIASHIMIAFAFPKQDAFGSIFQIEKGKLNKTTSGHCE